MIVKKFEADPVCDNRGLTDCDICEWAGVHHAGLVFNSAHEGGIDGISHPGGHGSTDLQISSGYSFSALVKRDGDFIKTFSQVWQIHDN